MRDSLFAFRLILVCGTAVLGLICFRQFAVGGPAPWADVVNTLVLVGALAGLSWVPRWWRGLAWIVFISFAMNALDGLLPVGIQPISSTHLLLPLLVLYGALLGDPWLSGAGMLFVAATYLITMGYYWPLTRAQFIGLTNLIILSAATGIVAWAVWRNQRRLVAALRSKTRDLEKELEENRRLQSVIVHDIANPLGAARNLADLVRHRGQPEMGDLEKIDRLNQRIEEIIESVREAVGASVDDSLLTQVSVQEVIEDLREVFSDRLASKDQRLTIIRGGDLRIRTHPTILSNSVLANVIANAIKFSPRGGEIEVTAWHGNRTAVMLEVCDRGPGFADAALRAIANRQVCQPTLGSDSEQGKGHGLWIAALSLARLGGSLEASNRPEGGGCVRLTLPGARREIAASW